LIRQRKHKPDLLGLNCFFLTVEIEFTGRACTNSLGSFAILAAIRRAATVEEGLNDPSYIAGNSSHTDNSKCCNIGTETPMAQFERNRISRNDKSPVSWRLGGGGPAAFLPDARRSDGAIVTAGPSFAGDVTSVLGMVLGAEGVVFGVEGATGA
jgi:hypothetical protein